MNKPSNSLWTLLVFCVILPVSCNAQQDKIVLINKNKNWEKTIISYWTPSSTIPITYHEMWANHQITKDNFTINIPTQEPLLFNFAWNFKIQLVCLYPGDTLEFRVTSNDSIPFQFGGSRPYNELMFYSLLETRKLGVLTGNLGLEVTDKLNYQYVADQTLERYKSRLKILEDQSIGDKISDVGNRVIAQSLYYQYLGELLFPYQVWKPIGEIGKSAVLVPGFYKAKLMDLETEFNKDSLMYLMDYRRFILQYARLLMFEKSGAEKIDLTALLNFYKKRFRGKKRDLLLFDEVNFNYQMSGDGSPIAQVIDSIENPAMRDTLRSIQSKSIREFTNRALSAKLETPSGEKHTLGGILSKNSGKLIYLDFWATWCGPCLMEMPDSKKLTQEFNTGEIEFVYFSIDKDKDKDKWIKKLSSLPDGSNVNHYRMADGEGFLKEMEIPGVPKYILIGKDGQMISFNSPRPRSLEIRNLITDNLGKKDGK